MTKIYQILKSIGIIAFVVLLSILSFIIVFYPMKFLDFKGKEEILGGFFFIVFIFYYVIVYNLIVAFIFYRNSKTNILKYLWKSVIVFICHVTLILLIVQYLNYNALTINLEFIKGIFDPANLYKILTTIIGTVVYYLVYNSIFTYAFKKYKFLMKNKNELQGDNLANGI